jgi:transposase
MAKPLVSDDLWAIVEPLLPPKPAHPKGGRPFPVSDRAALAGIIFVLKTGIQWEYLPRGMGSGCGMTCWRRLRAWQRAGVWQRLHRVLLQRLADAGKIDWSRASADAARVPAKGGANRPARTRSTGASRGPTTTW